GSDDDAEQGAEDRVHVVRGDGRRQQGDNRPDDEERDERAARVVAGNPLVDDGDGAGPSTDPETGSATKLGHDRSIPSRQGLARGGACWRRRLGAAADWLSSRPRVPVYRRVDTYVSSPVRCGLRQR